MVKVLLKLISNGLDKSYFKLWFWLLILQCVKQDTGSIQQLLYVILVLSEPTEKSIGIMNVMSVPRGKQPWLQEVHADPHVSPVCIMTYIFLFLVYFKFCYNPSKGCLWLICLWSLHMVIAVLFTKILICSNGSRRGLDSIQEIQFLFLIFLHFTQHAIVATDLIQLH